MPIPICPDCNSTNVLYKKKTSSFWCRRCGYEWTKKAGKKIKESDKTC